MTKALDIKVPLRAPLYFMHVTGFGDRTLYLMAKAGSMLTTPVACVSGEGKSHEPGMSLGHALELADLGYYLISYACPKEVLCG